MWKGSFDNSDYDNGNKDTERHRCRFVNAVSSLHCQLSPKHADVAKAQSFRNFMQHIGCLAPATVRIPYVNLTVLKSLLISFSFQ